MDNSQNCDSYDIWTNRIVLSQAIMFTSTYEKLITNQ
jgi:hypothetical protein